MQISKRCFHILLVGSIVFLLKNFLLPNAMALPIDWKGSFGANSTVIDSYRRTPDQFASTGPGSQFIELAPGNHKNATFQNYIFRLNPSIIVNDSISFHGEINSGYGRGGFFGDSTTQKKEGIPKTFGDALYLHNTSNGEANLNLSQIYLELFTDTATILVGRQPVHWGLGAIWNSGEKVWDRYSTIHDGLTAKFKIGNFHFAPFYAKINSIGSMTKASSTKTYGITLLYDNIQKDLTFGLLFGKRQSGSENTFYTSGTTGNPLGKTDVKITDLYLKKSFGKFTFAIEAPLISGDLGNVYSSEQNSKYKAQGLITESTFNINESWILGLNLGHVSGDDGQGPTYNALYLNPNYQIAHLMFRYNLYAVKDGTQNIYDSNIVNAEYLKLFTSYKVEAWSWDAAFIYAKANETPQIGTMGFNHAKNKSFSSSYKQEDDLGYEIDFGVRFQWNPNLVVHSDFGYHFVGDYYKYTNSDPIETHNSYVILAGLGVQF